MFIFFFLNLNFLVVKGDGCINLCTYVLIERNNINKYEYVYYGLRLVKIYVYRVI